jgi:DMSO/TMAO reductase YedYZ molybdopterin-dependent catalytic subunit
MIIGRRSALGGAAAFGAIAASAARAASITLPFENGERPLVAYPQKRPLARLTSRPPQLETPFSVFGESLITPNDAFYVRYHLADIPFDSLDATTFRLAVKGAVKTPLSLSLAELKAMPSVDLIAVSQCSGNSRGFSMPRVAGGQAGNGLMGNAKWTGVPLKAVLARAGIQAGAVDVSFNGLDGPVSPDTPDFVKSLPIDHANDGEVMLAWAMNGADLPVLNGFPLRLVVPGFYGTYWMKHLFEITVLDRPFDGFWMTGAYRIPDNDCACVAPGTAPAKTRPIGRFNVRSFITSLAEGAKVAAGQPLTLRGIAFDGGSGIREVKISVDGGQSWLPATLGQDLGRYSFRPWEATVTPPAGRLTLKVQAVANDGGTQPAEARWNPGGYMRNVIETTTVEAA